MRRQLIISEGLWETITAHLVQAEDQENAAFLLVGWSRGPQALSLLARDALLIPPEEVIRFPGGTIEVPSRWIAEAIRRCQEQGLALVELHSHPWEEVGVRFSWTDLRGEEEFVPYLRLELPGCPYASAVVGRASIDAHLWDTESANPEPIDEVRIVGRPIRVLTPSSKKAGDIEADNFLEDLHGRYVRQILAFGKDGQKKIHRTRVGIVGAGGTGSHVAQQLAYLGVLDFTLVDDDDVDLTNLNRLIGATPVDAEARVPKAEVAKRMILRIQPHAKVLALHRNVRDQAALDALKDVDVLFGCVDTDSGRLILNELATAYLIPSIDCGVGITAQAGRIEEIGGRVVLVLPGNFCLLCAQEIDLRVASDELTSSEEFEFRKARGYVAGERVEAPSVVSLNGVISSLAVDAFLALVTGYKQPSFCIYYDALNDTLNVRKITRRKDCIHCVGEAGLGDKANLRRYSWHIKVALPS